MVKFENRKLGTPITIMGNDGKQEGECKGYARFVIIMMNNHPIRQSDIDQHRMFKLMDKLVNADLADAKSIQLEDSEFEYIKKRIPAEWNFDHRDVHPFCEYIRSLKAP